MQLTNEQSRDFRQRLITQVYPELSAYLRDDQHQTIASNLQASATLARQALPSRKQVETAARIVSGCEATPAGDEYQPDLVQHVWQLLRQLNCNPELLNDLTAAQPSTTLMRRIFYGSAATISGRLRGHVGFSQAANTPFQGLAADGNKLAMFRLLRAGYQVCGFVHDECLILIPDDSDYTVVVQHVERILCDAMQELTPDIPITCEYLLADHWYKDVDHQPTDDQGRIVPYDRQRRERNATASAETAPAPEAQHALAEAAAESEKKTNIKPRQGQQAVESAPKPRRSRRKGGYDSESSWSFVDPGTETSTASEGGLNMNKNNGQAKPGLLAIRPGTVALCQLPSTGDG